MYFEALNAIGLTNVDKNIIICKNHIVWFSYKVTVQLHGFVLYGI